MSETNTKQQNGQNGQPGQQLQGRRQPAAAPPQQVALRQMAHEMDRLAEAFGFPSPRALGLPSFFDLAPRALGEMQHVQRAQQTLWSPAVEVFERDGQIAVHVELPGLNKDDVQIDVEDDVLTLRGERKSQHEEKSQGVFRSERSYGTFQRSFRLPEGTNPDQLQASFQDGVLEISIPKPQPQQPQAKRIEIK